MRLVSRSQYARALGILVVAHISIIAASNYLVQLPMHVFGLQTTWGALSFPFIFLATDLTVRIFGKTSARRIIFLAMLPALAVSYAFGTAFQQGAWQGMDALLRFSPFVGRIAMASFMAYVLGQILDIQLFDRLRRSARWWVAPAVSTVFGNMADTIAFFTLAFHNSPDAFMAAHWPEIAAVDYGFKITLSIVVFLPLYGVLLGWLQRRVLGGDGRVAVAG